MVSTVRLTRSKPACLPTAAPPVNPAVAPFEHLDEEFLGPHRKPYTGAELVFSAVHLMNCDAEQLMEVTYTQR